MSLAQVWHFILWLLFSSDFYVWVMTNPAYFVTAPLFVFWINFIMFIYKANFVNLPVRPFMLKTDRGDRAIDMYLSSWKYHLNRWLGLFPAQDFDAMTKECGLE